MTIKIYLGNVGSGKTASAVRYMRDNPHKNFITNIKVRGKAFNHVMLLKAEMLIKKVHLKTKRNGEEEYKYQLNTQYWKDLIAEKRSMNIIIDEAHIFFNPRRSMSKLNQITTDFLAMLRRVLGSDDSSGELILITQLERRIDVIAKEMATFVQYTKHHYKVRCKRCDCVWQEDNETPFKFSRCPECNTPHITRFDHIIEIYEFQNIEMYKDFMDYRAKTYFAHYLITDIEKIFGNYDTVQFDDLLSEY